MSGHTPGPWRSDWEHGVIRAPDESHIARMPSWSRSSKYGEANCRLLAAAPDLLEALRDAATTLTEAANCLRKSFPSLADNVIEKSAELARRAINKAEGR